MTPAEAVLEAAQIVGCKAELARLVGVSAPTVSQWCSGERPIPPARAVQIERLTRGQILRSQLTPTFPWETPSPKAAATEG
ncbi:putative antitoxin of bacterial toxin-antitoxin system, YdaS/YdaT [compost metagenome]